MELTIAELLSQSFPQLWEKYRERVEDTLCEFFRFHFGLLYEQSCTYAYVFMLHLSTEKWEWNWTELKWERSEEEAEIRNFIKIPMGLLGKGVVVVEWGISSWGGWTVDGVR